MLDEIRRVLKPGGIFLFDTINRTPLATLVLVHLGETLLGLLPRGTHDPSEIHPPRRAAREAHRARIRRRPLGRTGAGRPQPPSRLHVRAVSLGPHYVHGTRALARVAGLTIAQLLTVGAGARTPAAGFAGATSSRNLLTMG